MAPVDGMNATPYGLLKEAEIVVTTAVAADSVAPAGPTTARASVCDASGGAVPSPSAPHSSTAA